MGIKASDGIVYTVDQINQAAARAYATVRTLHPGGEMITDWDAARQEKRDAIYAAVLDVVEGEFKLDPERDGSMISRLLPDGALRAAFQAAVCFVLDRPVGEVLSVAVKVEGLEELERLAERMESAVTLLEGAE